MKNRGLSADSVGVHVGASVHIGNAIEEKTSRIEEAVFRGDMEEGCATQGEQAATGLAPATSSGYRRLISEGLASSKAASSAVRPRRIGRTPGGQEQLDAGREPFGGAGIGVDDVVECRAVGLELTAIGVSAVIEKPLERFGLEIFAGAEENGVPTPAEAVHVSAGADQEFHFCGLAWVRRTHQLLDEAQADFGIRGLNVLDERELARSDSLRAITRNTYRT